MILIVDDHVDTGNLLVVLLRRAGHDARAVGGGAEAIALLDHCPASLVILDVDMPDMDGLDVLRAIRQTDRLKDLPVLMYSAASDAEARTEAMKLGASGFLVKGAIQFNKLMDCISALTGAPDA